jgi:tetratricopeptide (TPR) repeat protein
MMIANLEGQSSLKNNSNSDYDIKFQQARYTFHRAYFEKASLLFDELLKEKPHHALAHAYAAMTDYMLYKDPTPHIDEAKKLLKQEDSESLFTMALLHFATSELSICESTLKDFLNKFPDDPYGMHVLGFTQIDIGRPEDGLETLTELLQSHPEFFPAYNHLGYAYLKLNLNDEAIEYFLLFLESDSLNPSAYDSYADGLSNIGQYDQAIAQLTKSVLLEPNFAYAWYHMGDIFQLKGDHRLAVLAYEKARTSAGLYGDGFLNSLNNKIKDIKK